MMEVKHRVEASPQHVFDVLADGWLFPSWVVGASRIRKVDEGWPAVGTRIHHSFGSWPLVIDDTTHVIECVPPRRLVLVARGWPLGEARVEIEIAPEGHNVSVVRLREDAIHGPGTLVPKPLRQLALLPRNQETLRRLGYLAEGDAAKGGATRPDAAG
jgi:uncharacterized protein YndB with AHSA1/START domain